MIPSWLFSVALLVLGVLMIYNYKRLADAMVNAIIAGWGRVINVSPMKESKFAMKLFRAGFVFAGIVALMIAVVNLTGPIQL